MVTMVAKSPVVEPSARGERDARPEEGSLAPGTRQGRSGRLGVSAHRENSYRDKQESSGHNDDAVDLPPTLGIAAEPAEYIAMLATVETLSRAQPPRRV